VVAPAGLFLVSFAAELTARSFAGLHGRHIRADQELLAMSVSEARSPRRGVYTGLVDVQTPWLAQTGGASIRSNADPGVN
jgi:MFS superfamily sulfate permease-like transporter